VSRKEIFFFNFSVGKVLNSFSSLFHYFLVLSSLFQLEIDKERLSSAVFNDDILQEIAFTANGDIRHAIIELQFQANRWKHNSNNNNQNNNKNNNKNSNEKNKAIATANENQKQWNSSGDHKDKDNEKDHFTIDLTQTDNSGI
jgi:hypothetical protein